MRRGDWSLVMVAAMVVAASAGCGGATSPAVPTVAQAPLAAATALPAAPGTLTASVEVEPARRSDMAFLIAAPVRQIKVKEGEKVKAGQPLIVLDSPELEFAVAAAQAELESAQKNVLIQSTRRKTTINDKTVYLSGPPEIRNKARARATQAQAALEVAQAELAQATLVAPFDGMVVSIDVQPGEMVQAHKTVLVIGDLAHLQLATTDLSEREIHRVRIGQKAVARLKAFDQDLTGKVVAIAPIAGEKNGDTVYEVTIGLDRQPQGLMWGMTGDVSIQTK